MKIKLLFEGQKWNNLDRDSTAVTQIVFEEAGHVLASSTPKTRVSRTITPPPLLATTGEPTFGSLEPTGAPNLHTSSPQTLEVAIIGEHQSSWRDLIHHRLPQTPKRKLRMHHHPYRWRASPSFDENTPSQHKSKRRNKDK
ncbi:hypothetical protein Bca101_064990 [Brassica carinata]